MSVTYTQLAESIKTLSEQFSKFVEKQNRPHRYSKKASSRKAAPKHHQYHPRRGCKYDAALVDTKSILRQKQYKADMDEAAKVMIDLRSQPGVVDPTKKPTSYYIGLTRQNDVSALQRRAGGLILGPAYRSLTAAENAIKVVGLAHIEKAFKTLLFIQG